MSFISLILTIILIILFLLLLRHVTRNFNYWKNRNIPYLKPIPFFGNVARIVTQKASIGIFLREIHKTTKSPYLGFFVFDKPFLLIRRPDLIKSILIKDFDYFCDRSIIENHRDDMLGSNVLFVMKNPIWKQTRSKLTPLFSSGKIKNMFPLMEEAGGELTTYISNRSTNKKSIETMEVCGKYATEVISSCAFGVNSQCFKYENAEFRIMAKRIFDTGFKRASQMASYFFAPFLVKPLRMKLIDPIAGKFMRKTFWKILFERERSNWTRGDLIDCLIQIRKEQENWEHKLDGDALVAQAIQYFVAGFETTGSTIAWALYELSLNNEIQRRLRHEIRSSCESNGKFSYESIQNMKYLSMVVNETLRKYPVLPFIDRVCLKDYHLPGTDVIIEKGIPIYISLFGIHEDPDYFPNPEKFDPERFSEENKILMQSNTYMPFGDGPRTCPGGRFALLSAKVAIVKILTEFHVEPTENTPVPITFKSKGVTIAPNEDLSLKFVPLDGARIKSQ